MYHHYNKKLKFKARELRNNPTKAEIILWNEILRSKQFFGYRFLRQRPIDQFIVDFFCPELKLIIEVDGISHEFDDVIARDIKREDRLKGLGYLIIRLSDWEIKNDLPGVAVHLTSTVNKLYNKNH